MSEKVLILLSTYNGEKYLEEQLNTILIKQLKKYRFLLLFEMMVQVIIQLKL